ncbi:MAG: hypothetical protein M1269_13660 [Chloroflexi bacterium]|nr:hypothetical protein [Chloroflexota bacterium]
MTLAKQGHYQWAKIGDIGAFFSLMVDNVTNLVFLSALLLAVNFPKEIIFYKMIPGTALGVLIGDLLYTWLAFYLAKKTGKNDITAMPLGLDTPSTIGVTLAVIVPTFISSNNADLAWKVGMATLFFIGIIKLCITPFTGWVRKNVPQAGLLGSLAGIGVALLACLPLIHVFQYPIVGLIAMGIILYSLVARLPLPWRLPGALLAVVLGLVIYHSMGFFGLVPHYAIQGVSLGFSFPLPDKEFFLGLLPALKFLPIALPFALLTIVGGINVTESARVAGDPYKTWQVIAVEGFSCLIAAPFGAVVQTTPYIGHPAYKAMGGRAAYTLATGLFIGLGGIFGYISWIVDMLPQAAVAPILMFVGIEIMVQAYMACPRKHAAAVAFAHIPVIAELVRIQWSTLVSRFAPDLSKMPPDLMTQYITISTFAHGFILTAMLWGAMLACLIDRKLAAAASYAFLMSAFSLFGIIHSVDLSSAMYLPWKAGTTLPLEIAIGYFAIGVLFLIGLKIGAQDTPFEEAEYETGPY